MSNSNNDSIAQQLADRRARFAQSNTSTNNDNQNNNNNHQIPPPIIDDNNSNNNNNNNNGLSDFEYAMQLQREYDALDNNNNNNNNNPSQQIIDNDVEMKDNGNNQSDQSDQNNDNLQQNNVIDRDHEIALQLQRQFEQQDNNTNNTNNNNNHNNINNNNPPNDFFSRFNMNNNSNDNGGSSSHFTFTMSDGNGNVRTFTNNNAVPQNMGHFGNNNDNDPFAAFNHPFFQRNNGMSGMGGMSGFNHPFFRNNNNNNRNPLNDQFGSMQINGFQPMMNMNIINNLMMGDGAGGFGGFQFSVPRPRVANQQNIDALPTDTYTEKKEDDNTNNTAETEKEKKDEKDKKETCSICLEEFKNGDEIRRLPCFHIFHKNEIDRWLRTGNDKCPICRVPINGQVQNQ